MFFSFSPEFYSAVRLSHELKNLKEGFWNIKGEEKK
jgi:hypothetical protein